MLSFFIKILSFSIEILSFSIEILSFFIEKMTFFINKKGSFRKKEGCLAFLGSQFVSFGRGAFPRHRISYVLSFYKKVVCLENFK